MSSTQKVSSHFKMGYRYFRKENLLSYQPEELIGVIFVAVDNYLITMYQAVKVERGAHFPFTLKILKVYDRHSQVWKVPTRILHDMLEVSARWFVGKATLIQCDEQGN